MLLSLLRSRLIYRLFFLNIYQPNIGEILKRIFRMQSFSSIEIWTIPAVKEKKVKSLTLLALINKKWIWEICNILFDWNFFFKLFVPSNFFWKSDLSLISPQTIPKMQNPPLPKISTISQISTFPIIKTPFLASQKCAYYELAFFTITKYYPWKIFYFLKNM